MEKEGLPTPFVRLRKALNIIETEVQLVSARATHIQRPSGSVPPPTALAPLSGVIARVHTVLQRKRQVILFGPPGTGKTYWAERAVGELAARAWFGIEAGQLDAGRQRELRTAGAIELCSFHPAYGYEDFLEGFRPVVMNRALSFELRDGVFKALCARAASRPGRPYF